MVRTNRNEIEFDGSVVRRWPLTAPDLEDLPNIAARHVAAKDLGLPVPQVLAVHADHLVLERAAGSPLVETDLDELAQARLGVDLARLLHDLRQIRKWPLPARDWPDLWAQLHSVAGTEETAHAAAVAAAAPVSLTHGDLSWGNLLVADDGALTAVIDWDGATLADPAMDFCALCANVDPVVARVVREQTPQARELQARADAYLGTWPVQHELWESGLHPWLAWVLRSA